MSFMNIDYVLLRQICVLSLFFGALCGLVTLIPFIGTLSFIFLICFMAPLVLWVLIKYNCITLTSIKDSIINGVIVGFVSYIGFSVIFLPISVILVKVFHIASNMGIGLMLQNANFFILVVLSMFMGVLSATVNAFTGFLTFYVMEFVNSFRK